MIYKPEDILNRLKENEYAKTKFTGEEERIVLDLHNFDENIYNIFKDHNNCVVIEWK